MIVDRTKIARVSKAARMILAAALLLPLVSACGQTSAIPSGTPEGSDRIVLEREEMTEELDTDAAALAYFVDARQHLAGHGFSFAEMDDDNLLLVTDPMQVDDNLALRIEVHAQPAPGGSSLIVSSSYSTSANAPANDWEQSAWTTGISRDAFEATVDLIDDLAHSDLLIGTE